MLKVPEISASDILTNRDHTGLIGNGSYGTVRLCKTRELQEVAVKCYPLEYLGEELDKKKSRIKNEANALLKLAHKHVVKIHGVCLWINSFGIIMEYLPGGNLDGLLRKKEIDIPWCLRVQIAVQLSEAISFLHTYKPQKAFIHGDIKPENVLLTLELVVKLADFGGVNVLCKTGASTMTTENSNSRQHTPAYTAPEFLKDLKLPRTVQMDVYSFGIVLYDIVTRSRVFDEASLPPQQVLEIMRDSGQRPSRPIDQTEKNVLRKDLPLFNVLVETMKICWSQNPENRPDITAVKIRLRNAKETVSNAATQERIKQVVEKLGKKPKAVNEDNATALESFRPPFIKVEDSKNSDVHMVSIDENSPLLSNQHEVQIHDKKWTSKKSYCIFGVIVLLLLGVFLVLFLRYVLHRNIVAACQEPPKPANGGSMSCYKNRCSFSCPKHYRMMENETHVASNFTLCLPDNTWSNPVPYCEKVLFCDSFIIPGLSNDSLCLWNNEKTYITTHDPQVGYRNGSTCDMDCSSDYILQGPGKAICWQTAWIPSISSCKPKRV